MANLWKYGREKKCHLDTATSTDDDEALDGIAAYNVAVLAALLPQFQMHQAFYCVANI